MVFATGLRSLIVMISLISFNSSLFSIGLDSKLEHIVLHYGYITNEVTSRLSKNKALLLTLPKTHQDAFISIQKNLESDLDVVRDSLYNTKKIEQATRSFTNHILHVCFQLQVKQFKLFGFPQSISNSSSIEDALVLSEKALKALENYYNSIYLREPILKRIEQALFYNFFTVKVVPKLVKAAGLAGSFAWLIKDITKFQEKFRNAKEKAFFLDYKFIQPSKAHSTHHVGWGGNGYNNHDATWAHYGVCHYGKNKECYEVVGINKNPADYLLALSKSSKYLLPSVVANYLSQLIEEKQLAEYNYRIVQRQKAEEQKKIDLEMKKIKINYEKEIDFSHIKGHDHLIKNDFSLLVDYLRHGFKYKTQTGTKSVLLYGPPGTGKTLIARAIAKESGAPFIQITADDILSETSKEKILASWKLAEKSALERPEKSAIIYLDELDCVVGNRTKGTIDPQRAKALSNLLTIFDGIEKQNPYVHILVIMTTNHYKNLDPALVRPGRIDQKVFIGYPDTEARTTFIKSLLPKNNLPLLDYLVEGTEGFGGAHIVHVLETASMKAAFNNRSLPLKEDYEDALKSFDSDSLQ